MYGGFSCLTRAQIPRDLILHSNTGQVLTLITDKRELLRRSDDHIIDRQNCHGERRPQIVLL